MSRLELHVGIKKQREVVVRVHVDETGRKREARALENALRLGRLRSHVPDPLAAHADVHAHGVRPGTVVHVRTANQEIEGSGHRGLLQAADGSCEAYCN